MTIATMFLVLNPAVVAALWIGYQKDFSDRSETRTLGIASVAAFAVLALMILVGEPLLDALQLSDATFLIAAGVLVIFSALQAFLRLGIGYPLEDRTWFVVALVLWLTSPAALAVAIAIRLDDGIGLAIGVIAMAVTTSVSFGLLWSVLYRDRRNMLLGWIRRGFAALAAIGGVDLIRQGVLSI